MIKNLIFDFGKVLVDYNFGIASRFFDNAEEARDFARIFSDPDFVRRTDLELVPFEETMHDLQRQFPQYAKAIQASYDHYTEFVTGQVPGMEPLLAELKAKGFRLFGLTNWCSKVSLTMAQYPIFRLLEGSVISSEEHLVKPDPAIYRILCQRYGLTPSECLFTDDRQENIQGAQAAGMQGVLFTTAEQYKKDLEELIK